MNLGLASQNSRKPRSQAPRGHSAEQWLARTFNMSPATAKLIAAHLGYQPQVNDSRCFDEVATEVVGAEKHEKEASDER